MRHLLVLTTLVLVVYGDTVLNAPASEGDNDILLNSRGDDANPEGDSLPIPPEIAVSDTNKALIPEDLGPNGLLVGGSESGYLADSDGKPLEGAMDSTGDNKDLIEDDTLFEADMTAEDLPLEAELKSEREMARIINDVLLRADLPGGNVAGSAGEHVYYRDEHDDEIIEQVKREDGLDDIWAPVVDDDQPEIMGKSAVDIDDIYNVDDFDDDDSLYLETKK